VRSMLYQCFISSKGDLHEKLRKDLNTRVNNSGTSNAKDFQSLSGLFSAHAGRCTGALTIVLDALDECTDAKEFLRCLRNLCKTTKTKVILTSRREKHLVNALDGCINIEVRREDIQDDVKAFVTNKVDRNPKFCHRPQLRERIIHTLVQGSGGMFLWVSLMMKELKSKPSIPAIETALSDLP
jgi:hypothetical protein